MNLSTALEFGRQAGAPCPKTIKSGLWPSRPKISLVSGRSARLRSKRPSPSGRSCSETLDDCAFPLALWERGRGEGLVRVSPHPSPLPEGEGDEAGEYLWRRFWRSTWERPISRSRCSIASGRLCDSCRIAPLIVARRDGLHGAAGRRLLRSDWPRESGNSAIAPTAGWPTWRPSPSPPRPIVSCCLDAGNQPLKPIILWPDRRAAELEAEVRERCSGAGFSATTGIPQTNAQFMAAKLLWLQRQCPEIWKRTRKLCMISDYLTFFYRPARHRGRRGRADRAGGHPSLPLVARDAGPIRN